MTRAGQLDLVTLKVTPKEARMLATSSRARSMNFEARGSEAIAREYGALSAKVDEQRRL